MATMSFIRELTVRGRPEGLDTLATALKNVKTAHSEVARAANDDTASTERQTRARESAMRVWERHESKIDAVARAHQRLEADVARADRAFAQGIISPSRYAQEMERVKRSIEAVGLIDLRPVDTTAFVRHLGTIEAEAKGAAQRSAAVFEAEFSKIEREAAQWSAMSPWQRLGSMGGAERDRLNEAAGAPAMTLGARVNANRAAEEKLRNMGKAASDAGKSAGIASHQWTNLGFQLNDAATMALSGSSAFQILATQGGQVFQILQDGPKGVIGSLKEIGVAALGLLTPLTLLMAAIVAVPVALAAFSMAGRRDVESLDDTFKRHAETIRGVKGLYGEVAAGLREAARESEAVLRAMAKINLAKLQEQAAEQGRRSMAALGGVTEGSSSDAFGNATGMTERTGFSVPREFAAFRTEIEALYRSYEAGTPRVNEFREAIAKRLDAPGGEQLRATFERIVEITNGWNDALARTPEAMKAIAISAQDAARMLAQGRTASFALSLREITARTPDEKGRLAYDRRFDEVRNDERFSPADKRLEAERAQVLEMARIRKAGSDAERQSAAAHGFDLREISARTVAQRAAIAADRARSEALEDTSRAANADAYAQRASARVLAEAAREQEDYTANLKEGFRARFDAANGDVAAVGMTETAAERLRMVIDATAQARQRAFQRTGSFDLDASEISRIENEADALSKLGEEARRARLELDLLRDVESLLLGEREAGYRSRIRGAGLDPDSAYGRGRIEIMRTIDALKEMKEVGRDAWSTLGDGLRSGEGFGKSLQNAGMKLLDDVSKRMWDNVYDQAFGAIGQSLGLGDLGLGGKPDGSSTRPFHVVAAAGSAGGLFGGLLNDNKPGGWSGLLKSGSVSAAKDTMTGGAPTPTVAQALGDSEWLKYSNQGATRSLPLDPKLVQAMSFLKDRGIQMEVFSGGQAGIGSGGPRTGSTRHDHGNAADVFFSQNGRRLDWRNEGDVGTYQDIVREARWRGVTGFGAGPGYMQPGSMHIGYGSPGVWGAGGRGANAPAWLRDAYAGGQIQPTSMQQPVTQLEEINVSQAQEHIDRLGQSAEASAGGLGKFGQGLGDVSGLFGGIGGMLGGLIGGKKGGGIGSILGMVGGKLLGGLFGFEAGGFTGHGDRREAAGVVHRGEFVFDAAATKRIGVGALDAMRKGLPGYFDGGLVDDGAYRAANDRYPAGDYAAARTSPSQQSAAGLSETVVKLQLETSMLRAMIVKESRPVARDESTKSGAKAVQVARRSGPSDRRNEQRHGHVGR